MYRDQCTSNDLPNEVRDHFEICLFVSDPNLAADNCTPAYGVDRKDMEMTRSKRKLRIQHNLTFVLLALAYVM